MRVKPFRKDEFQSRRLFWVLLVFLPIFAAGCAVPKVRTSVGVGPLSIDGSITSTGAVASGTADTESLGLDKDTSVVQPGLEIDWGRLHLSAEGWKVNFTGEGVAEATLDLDGLGGITVGAPVETDFDIGVATAGLVVDLISSDPLSVGLGIGGGYVDYDFQIVETGLGSGQFISSDALPFGFLSGRVSSKIWRVTLAAHLQGIKLEFAGDELSYFDLDLQGRLLLFDPGKRFESHLMLGYQLTHFDYTYDENGSEVVFDADFDGPYIGLQLSF